jgi:hypothetical protein
MAELYMGDIVNLRTARKRAKRRAAERQAALKRATRGRSKAERVLHRLRTEKAQTNLDKHKIETGDRQ